MAGALGENPSQQQRIMAKRVYQVWKGSNVSGLLVATLFYVVLLLLLCFVPEPWDRATMLSLCIIWSAEGRREIRWILRFVWSEVEWSMRVASSFRI